MTTLFLPKSDAIHIHRIPASTVNSIYNYINHRVPAGGFLTSVLENNLTRAVTSADEDNIEALVRIVKFLYRYAPGHCWGSQEIVNNWLMGPPEEKVLKLGSRMIEIPMRAEKLELDAIEGADDE